MVSGSVGTAMAYPTARELKRAGNKVISIVGARSKDLLVLEDEVRAVSDETYVLTDDGSYGEKGLVTDKLKQLLDVAARWTTCWPCGPVPMMRAVARMTAPLGIKTIVSLNSIMVDGTGMCGGCRVLVDNKSQFACVDGPEFDATQVNFEVLMQRNNMYREQERQSIERLQADPRRRSEEAARESARDTSAPRLRRWAMTEKTASHNPLPNKERIKLPRQRVPEQDACVRAHNFQEVNLGFPIEQARQESLRCIECPKPGCIEKCPVSVDVRAVIDLILAEDYLGAAAKVREDNALPAITGRVCPVEDQCESGCVLGKKGEPVGIAYLERFVADWERASGQFGLPKSAPATGKKVGLIGSGPAEPGLRRRPHPDGPPGPRVRGAARTGRRAGVRHSGIPAAEGHRAPRDQRAAPPRRGLRDQRGRRQDRDHR